MKLYFDLNQVLMAHENNREKAPQKDSFCLSNSLVPVSNALQCRVFETLPKEDIFLVTNNLDILNLNDFDQGAKEFSKLLQEVPLFRMRVEIFFDRLLKKRHTNDTVMRAVESAFEGQPLPQTVPIEAEEKNYDLGGKLHHPMIGHLTSDKIASLYIHAIIELRMLDSETAEQFSIREVLGSHLDRMLDYYDGYLHGSRGYVRMDKLITDAHRLSYDQRMPQDNQVQSAIKQAEETKTLDNKDILSNFAQSDAYQIRRCRQMDRFLSNVQMEIFPEWLGEDIAQLLQHEATKQVFALRYIQSDADASALAKYAAFQADVISCAEKNPNDDLQKLMSHILTRQNTYCDHARKFVQSGDIRQKEILLALA